MQNFMTISFKYSFFQFFMLSILVLTFSTSCKKYEEGPYISFRSKPERVSNSWKAASVTDNGKDVTSDYSGLRVTFTKSGGLTWTTGGSIPFARSGTWQFVNDKDDLQTIIDNGLFGKEIRTFRILKLKEDELWLKEGNVEYHLESA